VVDRRWAIVDRRRDDGARRALMDV
jgi:hypothetical protein